MPFYPAQLPSGKPNMSELDKQLNQLRKCENKILELQKALEKKKESCKELFIKIADIQLKENDHHAGSAQVRDLMQQRQQHIKTIFADREKLNQRWTENGTLLSTQQAKAENLRVQRDQMLQNDGSFISLQMAYQQAQENLNKEEKYWREIETEVKGKLPSFEYNRYYCYLKKQGVGTELHQNEWGIFRQIDNWLAQLINYQQNFANESLLIEIYRISKEKWLDAQEQCKQAQMAMDTALLKINDYIGLSTILDSIDQLVAQAPELAESMQQVDLELNPYLTHSDYFFYEARKILGERLHSLSETEQQHAVMATETREDDLLFKQVKQLQADIMSGWNRIEQLQRERNILYRQYTDTVKRSELEALSAAAVQQTITQVNVVNSNTNETNKFVDIDSLSKDSAASSVSSLSSSVDEPHEPNNRSFSSSDSFGGKGHSTTDSF